MTKINHVAYSWSMIQLQTTLEGESADAPLFVDATAIEWSAERKSEPIYGLGGQPRGRGFGNIEYSASIELSYLAQIEIFDVILTRYTSSIEILHYLASVGITNRVLTKQFFYYIIKQTL